MQTLIEAPPLRRSRQGERLPRVLFLASTKSQGGIERHAAELAQSLHDGGADVAFACRPGGFIQDWCRERGVPTAPFQVANSGDLEAALRLARMVGERRIDLVHCHSRRDYVIAVLGVRLAHRFGPHPVRLVLHAHMVRPLGSPPRLSARFFRWGADAVVAVSQAVADRLERDHGFGPGFVRLIHNGIDLSPFARPGTAEAARQRARRDWRIPPDAPTLGTVGRLDAKGQDELLSVAAGLAARHPGLRIVLVGEEGKAGARARLDALGAAAGLGDRLIFTGPRGDVPALLPALDALVHLPRDESFGLALAEAMAAGLPTVATDIGGCREVVRDGRTGLLVSPGDGPALARALDFLLDDNSGPARRAEMGGAGRRVVEEHFSRERQLGQITALYQELCPVTVR